jgi:hypothetical protein
MAAISTNIKLYTQINLQHLICYTMPYYSGLMTGIVNQKPPLVVVSRSIGLVRERHKYHQLKTCPIPMMWWFNFSCGFKSSLQVLSSFGTSSIIFIIKDKDKIIHGHFS